MTFLIFIVLIPFVFSQLQCNDRCDCQGTNQIMFETYSNYAEGCNELLGNKGKTPNHWRFDNVCNEHSNCYRTCLRSKKECDDAFYNNMINNCFLYCNVNDDRNECIQVASFFYSDYKKYGQIIFENDQNNYCKCVDIQ